MATQPFTCTRISGSAERITWTLNMAANDDGAWYTGDLDDMRTVQVFGSFGSPAGTATIQGTLEATPTNPITLQDLDGNPLSFTANGMEDIKGGALSFRPITVAGTGSGTVTVIVTQTRRKF